MWVQGEARQPRCFSMSLSKLDLIMLLSIRQRVKNNNPNVKNFLFDSGRPRRHDQLIFSFRKNARIEPVGIHDADAACRPLP